MSTVFIDKILIRRGNIADMPILDTGEFGLAEDEQRLFLGQKPVSATIDFTNSTDTIAVVTFYINENGYTKALDLDGISRFAIGINASETMISAVDTNINDTVVTFAHGLGRTLTGDDEINLYYNKEITSYTAEKDTIRQATRLTKTLPFGTAQETGITFNSSVKNDISIEYMLFVNDNYSKGKLDIVVVGDTIAKITNSCTSDTQLSDVDFSIAATGNSTFALMFDTSITDAMQFNYTQTSTNLIELVETP